MLLDYLTLILQQDCILDPTKPVLIGVSGGPDSLSLLDLFIRIGLPVIAAHVNHHLRIESDDEALFVKHFAEGRQIPYLAAELDVRAYAQSYQLSLEEAARILRYRFLFSQAEQNRAQAVAVAHTADDQVETLLMHLLRGAGLAGLRGMPVRALPNAWSQTIPLLRPLLGVWRSEIMAYCAERGLTPVFDRTNLYTTYFRNRLRHELIPTLETYNPQARRLLWRTAHTLADDYAVIEAQVEAAWQACFLAQAVGCIALDVEALQRYPIGIQRHLCRRAIAGLRPTLRDIDYETVVAMLEFFAHPTRSGQRELAAGLRLLWETSGGQARVWLAGWEAELPGLEYPSMTGAPQSLSVPGSISLDGEWRLSAEVVAEASAFFSPSPLWVDNPDPFQAWISLDDPSLLLRTYRPGDRFAPLGMGGHSLKLSDLFINHKLPRRARATWPLVCAGEQIIWAPGIRLGHAVRLTDQSLRVVKLRLYRETQR